MTSRSPARRILVLSAALVVLAQLVPAVATELLTLWHDAGPGWCEVPLLRAPGDDAPFLCVQLFRRPSIPTALAVLLVLLLLVGLGVCMHAAGASARLERDILPGLRLRRGQQQQQEQQQQQRADPTGWLHRAG